MDEKYYENLEKEICKLTDFLDQYEFIANAHTNDFITKDIWREVQAKFHLHQKEKQDEYFQKCETFSTITCCYGNFKREHCKYCIGYNEKGDSNIHHSDHRALNESDSSGETKRKLNAFVNLKKEHELDFLVPLINAVSNDVPCRKVVDFGSGKGYLGYELSSRFSLNVVGIEGDGNCSASADRWKRSAVKTQAKGHLACGQFKTMNLRINGDTSSGLISKVKKMFDAISCEKDGALLVGLHACGDLTSNALKIYAHDEYFRGLVVLGCCYNLLDTGFPLSSILQRKNYKMHKNAKMLACQCPVKWKTTEQTLSKSLLYRATFEKLLQMKGLNGAFEGIKFRKVGKKSNSFEEYVNCMIKRTQNAGYVFEVSDEEVKEVYQLYENTWEDLLEFHWLRMQLAPCIERLIILDRLLYLLDTGWHNSCILRVFSESISPRCYALVSLKEMVL